MTTKIVMLLWFLQKGRSLVLSLSIGCSCADGATLVVDGAGSDVDTGLLSVVIDGSAGTTWAFLGSSDLSSWEQLETMGGSTTVTQSSTETPVSVMMHETEVSQYFVRATNNFALRFYGSGFDAPEVDRVKIRIDDPTDATDPSPPIDVGAEDFTIEFWMRALPGENPAGAIITGADERWITGNIIVDRDRHTQGRDYGISLGSGMVAFGVSNVGSSYTIVGGTDVADGQWHHIAVQRRRSDGYLWLFVDGQIDAQADGPDGDISYPNEEDPGPYCGGSPCVNSDPFLVLGAEKHDAGPAYPAFSGWLDELRISNVLRYPPESFIRPVTFFTPDLNTMGLYRFDDGVGNVVIDSASAAGGPSHGVRQFGGLPMQSEGPEWEISTVPLLPASNVQDQNPPSVPQSLVAQFVDFGEVQLDWDASVDGEGIVAGYRVFRDGAFLQVAGTNQFVDRSGVAPLTQYSYTVAAVDVVGNISALSAPAVVNTPDADSRIVVDFDNPAPPVGSSALNGVFEGIDFGTGQWNWVFDFEASDTNSIYFSSNENVRSFSFVGGGRVLESLVVYTTDSGTLTLSDGQNPDWSDVINPGTLVPISTGWTAPSSTITVTFTAGWSLGIDELVHSAP